MTATASRKPAAGQGNTKTISANMRRRHPEPISPASGLIHLLKTLQGVLLGMGGSFCALPPGWWGFGRAGFYASDKHVADCSKTMEEPLPA